MPKDVKNVEGKEKEDWMQQKWRPAMGWMYMLVCVTDFVIFPVLWSLIQVIGGGKVETQWSPITLQGAGLFHMAMGAVLGIAAFGRTQEKMAGAAGGNGSSTPTSFSSPTTTSFNSATPPAFSSAPTFSSMPPAAPSFGSAPSFGAKPAGPGRTQQPEL